MLGRARRRGGVAMCFEEDTMTHFIRALSTVVVALAFTMAGCSGDGGGDGGEGGGGQGGSGAGASGAGGTTSNGSSTGSGMAGMDWKGTWNAQLVYTTNCDIGFGQIKTGMWDQTNTIQLSDNGNGGLMAEFPNDANYQMSGTGSTTLTLTGQYPAKDDGGGTASTGQSDNNVTIKLDTIANANSASGTVTGTYAGQFGQSCTIADGTATFTR
jgi:hypothetical protein